MSTRYLIVNADDLGLSEGVNEGVFTAHSRGIVTSASLMVYGAAASEAAALAGRMPGLSLGLHFDLAEWTYDNQGWTLLYERVPLHDEAAVAEEALRQLAVFRELIGKDPSHLDSHQHLHRKEPLQTILLHIAAELGVPLRHFTPGITSCGAFYGRTHREQPYLPAITVKGLLGILKTLQPGYTELSCHPCRRNDLDSMYSFERVIELTVLCDEKIKGAISRNGLRLCSFLDVDLTALR